MRVGPIVWDPPSCEGLLCSYCDSVVQESNPFRLTPTFIFLEVASKSPPIKSDIGGFSTTKEVEVERGVDEA